MAFPAELLHGLTLSPPNGLSQNLERPPSRRSSAGPASLPASRRSSPRPPAPARRWPPSWSASTGFCAIHRGLAAGRQRRWFTCRRSRRCRMTFRRTSKDLSREIQQLALERGYLSMGIRTGVRTGDTLPSERAAMLRNPPHILVTTPESLYILLTAGKSREHLRHVQHRDRRRDSRRGRRQARRPPGPFPRTPGSAGLRRKPPCRRRRSSPVSCRRRNASASPPRRTPSNWSPNYLTGVDPQPRAGDHRAGGPAARAGPCHRGARRRT